MHNPHANSALTMTKRLSEWRFLQAAPEQRRSRSAPEELQYSRAELRERRSNADVHYTPNSGKEMAQRQQRARARRTNYRKEPTFNAFSFHV